MGKRRIVVLGSTGSIGTQTLDVVRRHSDALEIVGLAVHGRIDELLAQAREFGVDHLAVGDKALADDPRCDEARTLVGELGRARCEAGTSSEPSFGVGPGAVAALTQLPEADVVVNALVGAAGLQASYETLAAGKVLALANKESLVVGGDLIMPLAAQVDAQRRAAGTAPAVGPAGALMPIDSEHGAIYQCLLGENAREVSKLWVTASGGPFRGKTRDQLLSITPAQALAHPTWNMGAKISIDSSTLMNKGLEVIEAHHLFAMPYDKIEVVVQPQSAIHSMVEFADGSVKAHLGTTDMRIRAVLPRSLGGAGGSAGLPHLGNLGVRGARYRYVPMPCPGASCWRNRRHATLRHERRQRGGGGRVLGRADRLPRHRCLCGGRHGGPRARWCSVRRGHRPAARGRCLVARHGPVLVLSPIRQGQRGGGS